MIVQSSSYVYLPLFLIYTVPFGKVCTNCTLFFFFNFFVRNNEDSVHVAIGLFRLWLVIDPKRNQKVVNKSRAIFVYGSCTMFLLLLLLVFFFFCC